MKIYLSGDTHGDITRFSTSNFPEGKDLTKEDLVIQLGDFGVIWDQADTSNEIYWMNWLADKPWTTLVVQGNHDNHDIIESLPKGLLYGGYVYEYKCQKGTVYFTVPGEVYTINGEKYLAVPKARSIDKAYRTEGRSWWAKEMLSADEENNTLDNLDNHNWKVHFLLSHTCPDSVIGAFLDNPSSPKFRDPVSRFLEFIANKLDFHANLFGHFHNPRTYVDEATDYYRCLFNEITELQEIKNDIPKAKKAKKLEKERQLAILEKAEQIRLEKAGL